MIQAICIFDNETRELLYDRGSDIIGKEDAFGSLFITLQAFASELSTNDLDSLKQFQIGRFLVLVTFIENLSLTLVLISDDKNTKEIKIIIPKLVEIILKFRDLFVNWDQNLEVFKKFNEEITVFIVFHRKLMSDLSELDVQDLWKIKGQFTTQLRENLVKEKEMFINKFHYEENIVKKYNLSKNILELSNVLQDSDMVLEFQTETNILEDLIKEKKLKAQYYLDQINESLKRLNYPELYSNLYSFSLKLQNFAPPPVVNHYKRLAEDFFNTKDKSGNVFNNILKSISSIGNSIDTFISMTNL